MPPERPFPKRNKEHDKNRSQVGLVLKKHNQVRYDKYARVYLSFMTLALVLIGTRAYFSNTD